MMSLQRFLEKATGKSFVINPQVINMDDASDRMSKMKELWSEHASLDRSPAVNVKGIDLETLPISEGTFIYLNKLGSRQYVEEIDAIGAVGCSLSHIKLWKMAAALPEGSIMVILEDDAHPQKQILKKLEKDPPDFSNADIILLGWNGQTEGMTQRRPFRLTSPKIFDVTSVPGTAWGSHAYAITPRGARELLKRGEMICEHVDRHLLRVAGRLPSAAVKATKTNFMVSDINHRTSVKLLSNGIIRQFGSALFVFIGLTVAFMVATILLSVYLKKAKK